MKNYVSKNTKKITFDWSIFNWFWENGEGRNEQEDFFFKMTSEGKKLKSDFGQIWPIV